MTTASMTAIRTMWESVNSNPETYSFRDMYLQAGKPNPNNCHLYYCADGRKFAFIQEKDMFVRYE